MHDEQIWRVMLVDDEDIIRRGLRGFIESSRLPFTVVAEAETAEDAIRLNDSIEPDVIIIDINMPGMNGLDLIRILRASKTEAMLVIVSGYDKFEYVRQALQLQVVDYLLKPVPKSDLVRILRQLNAELIASGRAERGPILTNIVDGELKSQQEGDLSLFIGQVKLYMETHYSDTEINLSKVAQLFHLNKTYLSTRMKQELGLSFNEYLTVIRVEKAKELLRNPYSQSKISNIASKVGYGSQYYFSRVFKQHTGISPLEYRQQL